MCVCVCVCVRACVRACVRVYVFVCQCVFHVVLHGFPFQDFAHLTKILYFMPFCAFFPVQKFRHCKTHNF